MHLLAHPQADACTEKRLQRNPRSQPRTHACTRAKLVVGVRPRRYFEEFISARGRNHVRCRCYRFPRSSTFSPSNSFRAPAARDFVLFANLAWKINMLLISAPQWRRNCGSETRRPLSAWACIPSKDVVSAGFFVTPSGRENGGTG